MRGTTGSAAHTGDSKTGVEHRVIQINTEVNLVGNTRGDAGAEEQRTTLDMAVDRTISGRSGRKVFTIFPGVRDHVAGEATMAAQIPLGCGIYKNCDFILNGKTGQEQMHNADALEKTATNKDHRDCVSVAKGQIEEKGNGGVISLQRRERGRDLSDD